MQSASRRFIRRQILGGLLIGIVLAVLPVIFFLPAALGVLIYCAIRSYAVALAVAFLVCLTALCFPVDRYLRKVGPFSYAPMPVGAVAKQLQEEWNVFLIVDPRIESNVVNLATTEQRTAHEVLEELATLSNAHVRYRGCGNSASLFFGRQSCAFLQPRMPLSGSER